jgi:AcrR family transcriptional regulator
VNSIELEVVEIDKFFKLRANKQEHIINAAFITFGQLGYKKASIADIADVAGIAKGMIIYYFGSKKNLYLYLAELAHEKTIEVFNKRFDNRVNNLFDRAKMAMEIKIEIIKEHPGMAEFLTRIYSEADAEVCEEIKKFNKSVITDRYQLPDKMLELSKLNENIDPRIIEQFIKWTMIGLVEDLRINKNQEPYEDFCKCIELMRKIFYNPDS